MICFECGEPAVALCRWCLRGQCAKHLDEGLAARSHQPFMNCVHDHPEVARSRTSSPQPGASPMLGR